MEAYWILPHPGVSAVFFDASEGLSLAELGLCLRRLATPCGEAEAKVYAGARWYRFEAESVLPEADVRALSAVSSVYMLFRQVGGDALAPVALCREAPFPEDLSAILKYTGKTNALFTRLMLHIAELSLPYAPTGRLRVLDPVAGKGTTLYEALMRGWDAAGIEIVHKAAHEAAVYFQKYLETWRWKHRLQKVKSHGAPTWQVAFARDKEALKAQPGEWTMIAGDSRDAPLFFGKEAFDIVCGDLPYGVAHGNVAGGGGHSRSPAALLEACLPAWRAVLRPQGILALSWNTFVFSTVEMVAALERHGFACLREPPYDALAHRVDASIRRDIVVGVRGR